RDEDDALRLEGLSELVGDRSRDLERARRRGVVPRLEHAEDPRNLALHVVRNTDRGGFGDRVVRDRGRLELCRTDSLARDVEQIVRAAVQEPGAVVVEDRKSVV